ncbi:hypothetical protein Q8G81_34130, partial [Klebsiella pneumoniae]
MEVINVLGQVKPTWATQPIPQTQTFIFIPRTKYTFIINKKIVLQNNYIFGWKDAVQCFGQLLENLTINT